MRSISVDCCMYPEDRLEVKGTPSDGFTFKQEMTGREKSTRNRPICLQLTEESTVESIMQTKQYNGVRYGF